MCTITTKENVSPDGQFTNVITVINNDDLKMVSCDDGAVTSFVGIATNKIFDISTMKDAQNLLLIKAVNNRTRERNYFRLYGQLADGEMTEEEFDKEIDDNKDDYVVPAGTDASDEEMEAALGLAPSLKDVNSTDDFVSLFGLTDKSVRQFIEHSQNG